MAPKHMERTNSGTSLVTRISHNHVYIIVSVALFINTLIFFALWLWIMSFVSGSHRWEWDSIISGGYSPLGLPCLSGSILNMLFLILWLFTRGLDGKVKLMIEVTTGLVLFIYGTFLLLLALLGAILIFPGLFGVLSLAAALSMVYLKTTKGPSRND